jgi:hypothetical protein
MRRNLVGNFSSVFPCVLSVSVVECAYFDFTTEAQKLARRHRAQSMVDRSYIQCTDLSTTMSGCSR